MRGEGFAFGGNWVKHIALYDPGTRQGNWDQAIMTSNEKTTPRLRTFGSWKVPPE